MDIETALRFTRTSVFLAFSWPPTTIETKRAKCILDLLWFLSILSTIGLLLPLIVSILVLEQSAFVLTQSVCFTGGIATFIVKTTICRIQRKRTQILIKEMEHFLESARPHEIKHLQNYVKRKWAFHAFLTFCNFTTGAIVLCGPLFLPQRFPFNAYYPFSTEALTTYIVIYCHHILVVFQCCSGITIVCQAALMMWFAGARLELLAHELKHVCDYEDFRYFVKKHQQLLWYASEVSFTVRYIAMSSLIMGEFGIIFGGLQVLTDQPIMTKMLFGPIVGITAMNFFMCSWPADNLIKASNDISLLADNVPSMSVEMMKNYLMIVARSQKPITVAIGGFLPTLSLRSYATYLSSAFSYATTLRIILSSKTAYEEN